MRCLSFRDAVNDMALHFLAKMKILVVRDIEREDIEFISKVSRKSLCLNCPHSLLTFASYAVVTT